MTMSVFSGNKCKRTNYSFSHFKDNVFHFTLMTNQNKCVQFLLTNSFNFSFSVLALLPPNKPPALSWDNTFTCFFLVPELQFIRVAISSVSFSSSSLSQKPSKQGRPEKALKFPANWANKTTNWALLHFRIITDIFFLVGQFLPASQRRIQPLLPVRSET